jgi:signal transduction histidine kinase
MRRRLPEILDWLPVLAIWVLAGLGLWSGGITSTWMPTWLLAVMLALLPLILMARRRAPLLVLLGSIAAWWLLGAVAGVPTSPAVLLTIVAALFSSGRYADRPVGYVAIPVTMTALILTAVVDPASGTLSDSFLWSLNVLWIFGIGAWLRQKDRLISLAADEAAERVRSAAAEERLRIARELHDVLAHSVSVMVVQAEAAEEVLDCDAEASRRALRNIQSAGRSALAETRLLLGVLRDPQEPEAGVAGSVHGMEGLGALLDRLATAGLWITATVGPLPRLPDDVSQTAYRVAQESLTNVLRHAPSAPVTLDVHATDAELRIEIADRSDAPPLDGFTAGHGLTGMRERVEQAGGTFEAGPTPDGFRVRAMLPLAAGAVA